MQCGQILFCDCGYTGYKIIKVVDNIHQLMYTCISVYVSTIFMDMWETLRISAHKHISMFHHVISATDVNVQTFDTFRASWRVLGNVDVRWCVLGNVDARWCVLCNVDARWCVMGNVDAHWCVLGNVDARWCVLGNVDARWCVLGNVDAHWCVLDNFDAHWRILGNLDVVWCVLGNIGASCDPGNVRKLSNRSSLVVKIVLSWTK